MREILFRGKNRDGEWVYGIPARFRKIDNVVRVTMIPEIDGEHVMSECVCVDPDTVGEYTGLTDKNSVRIFEGDIVETNGHAFEIAYRECGFQLLARRKNSLYGFIRCGDMLAVIGNVHDNPSLLTA